MPQALAGRDDLRAHIKAVQPCPALTIKGASSRIAVLGRPAFKAAQLAIAKCCNMPFALLKSRSRSLYDEIDSLCLLSLGHAGSKAAPAPSVLGQLGSQHDAIQAYQEVSQARRVCKSSSGVAAASAQHMMQGSVSQVLAAERLVLNL